MKATERPRPTVTLPNEPLLLEEAAEALRMRPSTLMSLRESGKGPKAKIVGGKLLFRIDVLDEWLNDQPDK